MHSFHRISFYFSISAETTPLYHLKIMSKVPSSNCASLPLIKTHLQNVCNLRKIPNKVPCLINFSIFPTPLFLLGPPLLFLRKLTCFTNSSFYVLSLLVLCTLNFQGKMTCFSIYFSCVFSNVFSFFPSLCTHLKSFLKF